MANDLLLTWRALLLASVTSNEPKLDSRFLEPFTRPDSASRSVSYAAAKSAIECACASGATEAAKFAAICCAWYVVASSGGVSDFKTDLIEMQERATESFAEYDHAWFIASDDANAVNQWGPLWSHSGIPEKIKQRWLSLKRDLTHLDADWSFWIEWYEATLNGTPLPWELTQRIALEITDAEWNEGQATVARRIEEIKAQFLSDQAPLAEDLTLDPVSGLFRVEPMEIQNPPLLGALLLRMQDSLDDALQGNNGLNESSREVRVLKRTVRQYSNDPQRMEMDFTSVAVGFRRQLHETQELPQSEDNLALLDAVEECVRGIRANHPDVAANRAQLAEQRIRELSDEDRKLLEEAKPVLEAISQDVLREDFATDIPQLINDATLPLPSGAPPLPGADETTRIFGRVSRMSILYSEMTAKSAEIFDSNAIKTVRLVSLAGGVLWALVQVGLRLFGVL